MKPVQFTVTPESGIVRESRKAAQEYLCSLAPGGYYLLAVKASDLRTTDQNKLLWRRYGQIAAHLNASKLVIDHKTGEVIECDAETVHNLCKNTEELNQYLPKNYTIFTDDNGILTLQAKQGTTTKLSRSANAAKAFELYYEAVGAYWQTRLPDLILD